LFGSATPIGKNGPTEDHISSRGHFISPEHRCEASKRGASGGAIHADLFHPQMRPCAISYLFGVPIHAAVRNRQQQSDHQMALAGLAMMGLRLRLVSA
jgi:hypothetical protein